jgi:hypothetical protein
LDPGGEPRQAEAAGDAIPEKPTSCGTLRRPIQARPKGEDPASPRHPPPMPLGRGRRRSLLWHRLSDLSDEDLSPMTAREIALARLHRWMTSAETLPAGATLLEPVPMIAPTRCWAIRHPRTGCALRLARRPGTAGPALLGHPRRGRPLRAGRPSGRRAREGNAPLCLEVGLAPLDPERRRQEPRRRTRGHGLGAARPPGSRRRPLRPLRGGLSGRPRV